MADKSRQTNITHRVGTPAVQYQRGDQIFDVGTVLRDVTKGWPGVIHEADRNNYLTTFGIPPRGTDDGYHAYWSLYNHQNTIGRFVRVMASDAEYPWLELKFPVARWLAATTYAADVLVYWEGTVYKSQAADNTGNNPASDDGTNWAEYDNDQGDWTDATDYVAGDVVEDDVSLWVCQLAHTSEDGTNNPNIDDGTNWKAYLQAGGETFDTKVSATGDVFLAVWLKNGATADNQYGISISDVDAAARTFKISIHEKIKGADTLIDGSPRKVGLNPEATNADGSPLFIEAVMDQYSDAIGVSLNDNPDFSAVFEHEEIVWFTGGDAGGTPTLAEYQAAWALFEGEQAQCDQFFMAGDLDPDHIAAALQAGGVRDSRVECDMPGGTAEAAETWAAGLGLHSHLLSFTYGRASFRDPFYPGGRKILALSGFATAVKAYCREKNKTLIHPSVGETPAGKDFGLIRGPVGIRNESNLDGPATTLLATSWINHLKNDSAGVIFWEQFTYYGEESELAYKRPVDLMNYVYKAHKDTMKDLQFRAKTDKEIIDKLSPVLNHLYSRGDLVNGETEGDVYDNEPFRIWIVRESRTRQIYRMMRTSKAIGPIILETILA